MAYIHTQTHTHWEASLMMKDMPSLKMVVSLFDKDHQVIDTGVHDN